MAARTKKLVPEMHTEIEKIKEELQREKKAESWSRYGEWKGLLHATCEVAKHLGRKKDLKKMIEVDERMDA